MYTGPMGKQLHRLNSGVCPTCGPITPIIKDGHPRCPNSSSFKGRWQWDRKERIAALHPFPGYCEICRTAMEREQATTDHDHASGVARGWLCRSCNLGLGYFKDDPTRLQAAIEYLA